MLGMIKNSLFGSVETWPWQVLSKGSKGDVFYEERACEGGKFATVEVTDKPVDEALREAMPKVMKYVGGSNDKGLGMGMTVPISFAVFPSDDGDLQKKLKVWFRIPNKFQSDPPAPSDDSIKIEDREGITVYSTLSWISVPGSGRCPEEENGTPLQCFCLENSMDRGTWQATVHGVAESDTAEQPSL
ncbi:heme-binding protein 1 isoform X2 [Bubalus kerabau]|uniref:heme-binding protein 1 isoform X2 n=1 Tax=Bubalus carabanensis TaxID=3119969 RepID=UPI000DBC9330|nr:heme-binding protein 1 isoform X2 [Bubalus bubalis]XP_055426701.1 heme-binding protein 1 isoform X2 [Bubalus carabanensis]